MATPTRRATSGARQSPRGGRVPPASRRQAPAWLADHDAWVLVPLRAFLGVTFIFAGLQKLADRWFFNSSAPSSLQAQLHAASRTSPIGSLVGGLNHQAILVGLLIAFAELGIGLGTLLGLWSRVAATGGLLLSVGFLLTVSWHTRPYYYGADVVFVFAWTPLILAGAGRWSLDGWAAAEARSDLGLAAPQPVTLEFATIQRLCGAYDGGRCRARNGQRCRAAGCPVLADDVTASTAADIDRRTFLQQAGIAGWLASAAVLTGGAVAIIGRLVSPRPSHQPSTTRLATGPTGSATPDTATSTTELAPPATPPATTSAPTTPAPAAPAPTAAAPTTPATAAPTAPAGTRIGPARAVPVGGAAQFTDPATGDPAYVVQPRSGTFVAFDAICTHQGCTVEFTGSLFQCPCHGAEFEATTGQVVRGPAQRPLAGIRIKEGSDGNLYVT